MFDPLTCQYYGHSDFNNWGYWLDTTQSQKEACEILVEKLLDFLPAKRGTILDVACGMGATTRYLLNYFPPEKVTGINISEMQLRRCCQNAPGCTFYLMDATRLDFDDDSFDNVICVEAAFHFDTRMRFFKEAYRVLRPGGTLILSDVLFTRAAMERSSPLLNPHNFLEDKRAYRMRLKQAGFCGVRIIDATERCWWGYERSLMRYVRTLCMLRKLQPSALRQIRRRRLMRIMSVKNYLLIKAKKPRAVSISSDCADGFDDRDCCRRRGRRR
jgi:SAM-dependent methyltransferase